MPTNDRNNKFKRIARLLIQSNYELENASPDFVINLLAVKCDLSTFQKLNLKILNSPREWTVEFIKLNGIISLLDCVERIRNQSNIYGALRFVKCIGCIKSILNLEYGMERVINLDRDAVQVLAKSCCLNAHQSVKNEFFLILSAIAMFSESGYHFCFQILEVIKVVKIILH